MIALLRSVEGAYSSTGAIFCYPRAGLNDRKSRFSEAGDVNVVQIGI
jgi:hypothetical protein